MGGIRNIDKMGKLPNQNFQRSLIKFTIIITSLLSAMFSEKDFFGDPQWPSNFESSKKRPQKQDESEQGLNPKLPIAFERQQNSMIHEEPSHFQEESQDIEQAFLHNELKIQYSNLKHSEITYLDDFQKQNIFYQESDSSPGKDGECENQKMPEQEIRQSLVKFEQEGPFSDYQSENESEDQNYVPEPLNSLPNENPPRKSNSSQNKLFKRRSLLKVQKSRRKTESYPLKVGESIIDQLLDENCLMADHEKKIKMLKVENEIIKKLKYSSYQNLKFNEQKNKKLKKCKKMSKYKILTQGQKEYLVFLSSITTTCQVARKFQISVNNICRWKKGCVRKVGAGRKITNQQLEQKMIDYVKDLVKNGELLTRKKVQLKAKQLSTNKNFKASKGWFERFYTRNIGIFPPQQNDEVLNEA